MQMHQVRYFLALCEERNFTRAAKSCGVSQPSLTNAIKQLELELGGPLFLRERGGIQLNELGQRLQPNLKRIDQCAREVAAEGKNTQAVLDKEADDAATEALGSLILSWYLARLGSTSIKPPRLSGP